MTRHVLAACALAFAVAVPTVAAAETEAEIVAAGIRAESAAPSTPTHAAPSPTARDPTPATAAAIAGPSTTEADAAIGDLLTAPAGNLDPLDGSPGLLLGGHDAVRLNGFVALEMLHDHASTHGGDAATFAPQLHLAARAHIARGTLAMAEIGYEHAAELRVDRALVEVQVARWLTLRAGRLYAPVSYDRLHHYAPVRLTTTRPLLADIAFGEWTDAGIEVSGRYRSVSWNLAVVNGPAALSEHGVEGRGLRDNNADKAVVARLSWELLEGLQTGAAAAYGHYDSAGRLAFRNVELDARLRRGPLDVWFEYDRRDGDDEPCTFDGGMGCDALFTGARAGQQGAYLLAAYGVLEGRRWIQYLKPLVRIEFLEELHTRSPVYRATAGLAWSPLPHVVVKVEGGRTDARGAAAHNDAFASVAADF